VNLRLQNPLRGSREPWPLASRLVRFVLTGLALLFFHLSSRVLQYLVERFAGLSDPQGLPERPRQIVQWMSHLTIGLLFLSMGMLVSGRPGALWPAILAWIVAALAGQFLRRTVWGLPNAFREPDRRLAEMFRRVWEVIRGGPG
jgi:hypothetical protein